MNYPIQDILSGAIEQRLLPESITYQQTKVLSSIVRCKTHQMGGHITKCNDCGHETIHYNSCRNRHCPCCQEIIKEKWIDKTKSSLINAPYFHVVFTVPHALNPIFYSNQKIMYNLFYTTVAQTLKELALDPKYGLEAQIGFIAILHTWGSNLSYHPHIHVILLAGGLTHNKQFVENHSDFLFPFPVMANLFRGKFMHHLNALWTENKLDFKPCSDAKFFKLKNQLYHTKWVPYAKKTFKRAEHVIEYLGRYTHKIAISNNRILAYDHDTVSFGYKDYKSKKRKIMTLPTKEFTRRFLMHVLPRYFVRIRHYGILSNRNKKNALSIIRTLIHSPVYMPELLQLTTEELLLKLFNINVQVCTHCKSQNIVKKPLHIIQRE